MKIEKVGVVGLGAMGSGIAQVAAQAGCQVHISDMNQDLIDMATERIRRSLSRMAEKGKISREDVSQTMERLHGRLEIEEFSECDLVIEAIIEDMTEKGKLFQALDKICPDSTIFASNTSMLSITDLAALTERKARFIGLHFFNPPTVMKLVEVVRTVATDQEVLESAVDFVKSLGKVPVMAKDNTGFIVNYLSAPFMYDAMRALSNGVATVEDIDNAMELGAGHPMGPLKLADFIGLDILVKGGELLFQAYKEERYSAPNILKRLVAKGNLGQKSGRGFYDWSDPKNPVPSVF